MTTENNIIIDPHTSSDILTLEPGKHRNVISECAIYLGDNQVLVHDLELGVTIQPLRQEIVEILGTELVIQIGETVGQNISDKVLEMYRLIGEGESWFADEEEDEPSFAQYSEESRLIDYNREVVSLHESMEEGLGVCKDCHPLLRTACMNSLAEQIRINS